MRIIIATRNESKLKEIKEILKDLDISLSSLNRLKKKFRIVENGETFLENAAKKAIPVSKKYKSEYVLGEDSGLKVNYLKGKPGIYSKRYASKFGNQKKNNEKVLEKLKNVPAKNRGASFCCCLVLAKNGKIIKSFDGRLFGRIADSEIGSQGFGYDPIFYLPKYRKTVAQMPLNKKNRISHRAKAFGQLKKFLMSQI